MSLHEHLLQTYEFRNIPRLPPKQLMLDAFLEERRIGLQRWLILISQHAILSRDEGLKFFLTETINYQHLMGSTNFPDEFSEKSLNIQLQKFNNVEEVHEKRKHMRQLLNQILTLKRLISQQMKSRVNQAKDYAEMSEALSSLINLTSESSLKDFSEKFSEVAKHPASHSKVGVIERLELIVEVLTAYNDLCDRVIDHVESDEKSQKSFNTQKLRDIFRTSISNCDDEIQRIEINKKRMSFGIYCVIEEYKTVEKYLKLLPCILLQFTFEESKCFAQSSTILQHLIDIESDKLN